MLDGRRAPVGRVAAIINRSHNARHGDRVGFFGWFFCAGGVDGARKLIGAASAWLAENGCDEIRGPYNPSINEECGLLVEGFEGPPCISMPWNLPGDEALLTACGFSRIREMDAYDLDLSLPLPERVARIRERMLRSSKMRLRTLRMERLREELPVLRDLYNSTLDRNWGFVPVTLDDLEDAASDLRAVADPELILIVEREGKPGAIALSLPNFNEILLDSKKFPRFLRPLFVLWRMRVHKYERSRLAVLGISPDFRDRGISAWLFAEQYLRSSRKFRRTEISWIERNNAEILRNTEMMGAKFYRRYAIFGKSIPASPDPER